MRVKLQYSVDLEEVPKESRKLFSRANEEIRDASDHMDDVFITMDSSADYESILDSIGKTRKNLSEADFRLGDAEAILRGYLQARYAPQDNQGISQVMESIKEKLDSIPNEGMEDE